MFQAIWKDRVIAESDTTEVVEGNHYFPVESVNREFLRESKTSSFCGWKGDCSYYDVVIGDEENKDAAWVYREPYTKAAHIKGFIAFWKGVVVREGRTA